MTTDDAAFADRLDRFLDALASGAKHSPNGLPALEPQLAESINRLRTLDDAPRADSRFADHLLEDLTSTARAIDSSTFYLDPALFPGHDRRGPSRFLPQHSAPQPHWALTHLATAALIVLTLVGSVIILGPGRSWQQPSAPAFLPAISATPATPDSGGVETTSLLDLVIPTIGDDQGFVAINRYTIPPATTLEADMQGAHIPSVFLLAAGELDARAIDAPEPVRVVRAGGVDPEEVMAKGEQVALDAGDAIVIPENGAADLMNLSNEPAIVLYLLQPSYITIPLNNAIENESLGGSARELRGPLAVSLQQATLAPGATLPGDDTPNVEQFAVPVDPDRIMDARASANGALRNAGDEPLEAYILTVTSGTPTTESEISSETLIDETVDALPADRATEAGASTGTPASS